MLGGIKIGVYIIAEAGVNHNGDIQVAKKLIDLAAMCGADAVKFQTFKAAECTTSYAPKATYQMENMPVEESQLDMITKLELTDTEFGILQAYCKEKHIMFLSTPFGEVSLKLLVQLDLPIIKVSSTDITNLPFLKKVGETGKEIILSTGMATYGVG